MEKTRMAIIAKRGKQTTAQKTHTIQHPATTTRQQKKMTPHPTNISGSNHVGFRMTLLTAVGLEALPHAWGFTLSVRTVSDDSSANTVIVAPVPNRLQKTNPYNYSKQAKTLVAPNHGPLLSAPFTLRCVVLPCASVAGGVTRPPSGALANLSCFSEILFGFAPT